MSDKKIIDIAGPGDSKVDIGSKPMIVGHKSMASDPMMREKQVEPEKPEAVAEETIEVPKVEPEPKSEPIEPPSVKQKTIEPLSEDNKPVEKAPDTKQTEEPEEIEKEEKPKTEEQVKSEKANAELDETALELEKEENLRKIIESKKYHVNIKQARGESKSWIYVLIGLVVSAIIVLFVLVDTGKLDIGVKLPFSIFGSESSSSEPESPKASESVTDTETSEALEEAQAIVVDKTKITEVDLLLRKPGDESLLPETASESFVEYMKEKLSVFECESETGGITISKVSTEFVSGGGGCEGGYAAFWYMKEGVWQELGTQDTIPCIDVIASAIPIEFIDGCFDETTGLTKANPNGSIVDYNQ